MGRGWMCKEVAEMKKKYRWNARKFLGNLAALAIVAVWAAVNVWILYEWIMGA